MSHMLNLNGKTRIFTYLDKSNFHDLMPEMAEYESLKL